MKAETAAASTLALQRLFASVAQLPIPAHANLVTTLLILSIYLSPTSRNSRDLCKIVTPVLVRSDKHRDENIYRVQNLC